MKATRIVHGAPLEVACYGQGDDWLLRLSHARLQPQGRVNDAFVPTGEIGFLWARRIEESWIVSGMVLKTLFPQTEDVREFLDWALKYLAGRGRVGSCARVACGRCARRRVLREHGRVGRGIEVARA